MDQQLLTRTLERQRTASSADSDPQVHVTGSTAVVQVELQREGKHIFTDYLSLYKLPEGWRIVAKTFEAH